MTLQELQHRIKAAFEAVDYLKSVYFGSAYDEWTNHQPDYYSAVIDLLNVKDNSPTTTVTARVYVADRLPEGYNYRWGVWDKAVAAVRLALNNMMATAKEEKRTLRVSTPTYNPFVQSFGDELTGVWCDVEFTINNDIGNCQQ